MTIHPSNRMKCALNEAQLNNRLNYNPDILELHLIDKDLYGEKRIHLIHTIRYLKNNGIKVYLHHPMLFKGQCLDIISNIPELKKFYKESCLILNEICQREQVKCVIHANYSTSDNSSFITREKTIKVREEIEKIIDYSKDSFLWEDSVGGIFSLANKDLIPLIIEPLNLPLVQDISHSFISLKGNNDKLFQYTEKLSKFTKYYHIVDSMGLSHDGLPLGEGKIEWSKIKPFTVGKDFIFEISLQNFEDCTPMIKSAVYYNSLKQAILSTV